MSDSAPCRKSPRVLWSSKFWEIKGYFICDLHPASLLSPVFFTLAASSLDLPSSIRLHLFHCHCLIVGSQQQATVQQPSSLSSSWRSVPRCPKPLAATDSAAPSLRDAARSLAHGASTSLWDAVLQSLKMPWLAHQYLGILGDLHVLMCIYRYMTTYELHMIYIYIYTQLKLHIRTYVCV